jgi:WD40 repeat protein
MAVRDAVFDAQGKAVALTGHREVEIRDPSSGKPLGGVLNAGYPISKVSLSPGGSFVLAVGSRGELRAWETQKGGDAVDFPAIRSGVRAAVFSPDGKTLAVALRKNVDLWETGLKWKEKRRIPVEKKVSDALFSPDGKTLILIQSDGGGILWDVAKGSVKGLLPPGEGPAQMETFSRDGSVLAVVYRGGKLRFFDVQSAQAIGDRLELRVSPQAVSFAPDGMALMVLGRNGRMERVDCAWLKRDLDPARLLRLAEVAGRCRVNDAGVMDPLSAEEWIKNWRRSSGEETP